MRLIIQSAGGADCGLLKKTQVIPHVQKSVNKQHRLSGGSKTPMTASCGAHITQHRTILYSSSSSRNIQKEHPMLGSGLVMSRAIVALNLTKRSHFVMAVYVHS